MQATDIGPHPDAPDFYLNMRKPESWAEEDCKTLGVRYMAATADKLIEPAARVHKQQLPSGEEVFPVYVSEWQPDAADLERLAAGEPIRLMISGSGLPPVAMWVKSENEI